MDFEQYIIPELLVLIPVLMLIGNALKRFDGFEDRYVPIALGVIGIVIACLYEFSVLGFSSQALYTAIIQGILCAGSAVYVHQLYKQTTKVV